MEYINPNEFKYLEDDSAMIQAAVDEAERNGCAVLIPRLNERTGENKWVISRAIRLPSMSSVCLKNCHVVQAEG